MRYGYIRVSSTDQNPARQIDAMKNQGLMETNVFIDKESGKDFDRCGYKKLMSVLKKGDVLVIKSIDRLGRNYDEVLEQWRIITREKGVNVEVIDMPLLSTRHEKNLTEVLISDVVLELLSYVAQTEREFIRQRQAEGIASAKQRGVKFGRRPKPKPDNYKYVKSQWVKGEISARKAAKLLNISHSTFARWVENDNEKRSVRYTYQTTHKISEKL